MNTPEYSMNSSNHFELKNELNFEYKHESFFEALDGGPVDPDFSEYIDADVLKGVCEKCRFSRRKGVRVHFRRL